MFKNPKFSFLLIMGLLSFSHGETTRNTTCVAPLQKDTPEHTDAKNTMKLTTATAIAIAPATCARTCLSMIMVILISSMMPQGTNAFTRHALFTANNSVRQQQELPQKQKNAQHALRMATTPPLGDFFRNLGQELDNFLDDAMDRKLAGGSTFYGERKSSFSSTTTKKSYKDTSQVEALKRDEARRHVVLDAEGNRQKGGQVSGEELRNIIVKQWNEQYPVLIKRRRDALGEPRLYLVIQWKPLGKKNLFLTKEEYVLESDAVADLLSDWGVANQVRNHIAESGHVKPKTMTQQYPGLFIPLDVDEDIVATW